MARGQLSPEGQTLSHLGLDLKSGLTAIVFLSGISFLSSTILFFYLSWKLVTWNLYVKNRRGSQPERETDSTQQAIDFTLGIDGVFSDNNPESNGKNQPPQPPREPQAQLLEKHPNQFLILIINLLLADMHQSLAFLFNIEWLSRNSIVITSPTCFVQGMFVSLGDLASSMFITAIAIHTHLAVVRRQPVRQRVLYAAIAVTWLFVYAISLLPIAGTRNGTDVGGFYVRAGAWCWMNNDYENLRLLTHYLFIFIALALTSIIYIHMFLFIRRQERSLGKIEHEDDASQLQLSRNPAFLIYPIIYVMCTLPLATGRIATMAGANVPLGYFCFAGAMISSNGSFDCLIFGSTRTDIVFASMYEVDAADVGLKTFAFMKTPTDRRFGNVVSIQGGRQGSEESVPSKRGWWRLSGRGASRGGSRSHKGMFRTTSQESLRGPAIQMDTITSVVVEIDGSKPMDHRYHESSMSESVHSVDKDVQRAPDRTV
ncbi:hypothetical protein BGZ63DRAFT_379059 [Mariannaea sp. PMI_226]|nr:hypothetical protein BGZ63DRAFT_379059 [Mariannaea sp. PMI_226]